MKKIFLSSVLFCCLLSGNIFANNGVSNNSDNNQLLFANQRYTKFDLKGYEVRILPSDRYSIEIVNKVKTIQSVSSDGTLHLSVIGSNPTFPTHFFKKGDNKVNIKDTIIIHTDHLEYLSVSYGNLIMTHPCISPSIEIHVRDASSGIIRNIQSDNLKLYVDNDANLNAITHGKELQLNVNKHSQVEIQSMSSYVTIRANKASTVEGSAKANYISLNAQNSSRIRVNSNAQKGFINAKNASHIKGQLNINESVCEANNASSIQFKGKSNTLDLKASKASRIQGDINVNTLTTKASTASTINLSGTSKVVNNTATGFSKINISNLRVANNK